MHGTELGSVFLLERHDGKQEAKTDRRRSVARVLSLGCPEGNFRFQNVTFGLCDTVKIFKFKIGIGIFKARYYFEIINCMLCICVSKRLQKDNAYYTGAGIPLFS